MNRWYAGGGSLLVAIILAAIIVGIGSCVRRDWQFEDACRRSGGIIAKQGGSGSDICARSVEAVPLSDYRR